MKFKINDRVRIKYTSELWNNKAGIVVGFVKFVERPFIVWVEELQMNGYFKEHELVILNSPCKNSKLIKWLKNDSCNS